ncbi:MAG TPA: hypothetical protein VIV60_25085 [Polyangiaceae bacterium]
MNTARNALERLSLDPEAQRLADERETALLVHQHYIASAFEAGKAKGAAEERLESVRSLCEVLSIEIDEAKERQLSSLEPDQLSCSCRSSRANDGGRRIGSNLCPLR